MNILVTGANGQLGNELRRLSSGSRDRYIFTDVNEVEGVETVHLDITDVAAVSGLCNLEEVDVIINCAAYTNVDKAEDDEATANLLNNVAVANLAAAAKGRNATLFHISTDYIFNVSAGTPVKEDQTPDPQSAYGRTKFAGEQSIVKSGCKSIVIRTAWLYSPYGKNFVKTMQQLTAQKDSLKVVYDQVGTPTYAADLAQLILHIIASGQMSKSGVYHYSNEGAISWYDFAQCICELSGNECDIQPCLSSEFPSKVHRPNYSVLDKSLVKNTFGVRVPYWKDSLVDCIKRI